MSFPRRLQSVRVRLQSDAAKKSRPTYHIRHHVTARLAGGGTATPVAYKAYGYTSSPMQQKSPGPPITSGTT